MGETAKKIKIIRGKKERRRRKEEKEVLLKREERKGREEERGKEDPVQVVLILVVVTAIGSGTRLHSFILSILPCFYFNATETHV